MSNRFWTFIRGFFGIREADEVEVPIDDRRLNADDGIQQSIMSLQNSFQRRPAVDEVVGALETHRRENHFGEKLGAIFENRR